MSIQTNKLIHVRQTEVVFHRPEVVLQKQTDSRVQAAAGKSFGERVEKFIGALDFLGGGLDSAETMMAQLNANAADLAGMGISQVI